jgi:hypothetical protein
MQDAPDMANLMHRAAARATARGDEPCTTLHQNTKSSAWDAKHRGFAVVKKVLFGVVNRLHHLMREAWMSAAKVSRRWGEGRSKERGVSGDQHQQERGLAMEP